MARTLSSQEGLERMCEISPNDPKCYGTGKVILGAGLGAIGAVLDISCYALAQMARIEPDAFGIALSALSGAAGAGLSGAGLYYLADGITSLVKPSGLSSQNDAVYYRNGGFTKRPSFSDRLFGRKVTPIENIEDLNSDTGGYIFANGILVKDTEIQSHVERTTTVIPQILPILFNNRHKIYRVVVNGELKEEPVKVFTVTEEGDFARRLAETPKDSLMYAFGKLNIDGDLRVKMFGHALAA